MVAFEDGLSTSTALREGVLEQGTGEHTSGALLWHPDCFVERQVAQMQRADVV
jgi:hypothetical protein